MLDDVNGGSLGTLNSLFSSLILVSTFSISWLLSPISRSSSLLSLLFSTSSSSSSYSRLIPFDSDSASSSLLVFGSSAPSLFDLINGLVFLKLIFNTLSSSLISSVGSANFKSPSLAFSLSICFSIYICCLCRSSKSNFFFFSASICRLSVSGSRSI